MISLFDLFRIGIGPSSSHTVGPMRAAHRFMGSLPSDQIPAHLKVTLYGSLAWTAKGHATDRAVILGLAGEIPETVDPAHADRIVRTAREKHVLHRAEGVLPFDPERDIILDRETVPVFHPNTLQFEAFSPEGDCLSCQRFCSVGGGFIVPENAAETTSYTLPDMPHDFRNGEELLARVAETGMDIAGVVLANESALRARAEIEAYLDRIADVMMNCIKAGLHHSGTLPGRLNVRRRAATLYRKLEETKLSNRPSPHAVMDWISLFAIAVNEENASGGRVVTAPTNGASGVIPAVLRYYRDFCPDYTLDGQRRFLLTAAAIGGLFKLNASISGAEVGCQGEVGVAASMAAAGLAAALGATPLQVENAAEIAMEHHLGMTCDPVAGLVQIPCIERNAFGAVKAINAASLAMHGDGSHHVSLDQVIRTMAETGRDMNHRYKETSLGGLAVNFPEC
ncbi:L-serine ammonia-lyase [Gluconobacter morbifer]|uniref:L-serine dehydratase n=1 Tax=Gluconobacter morbifer G707 TaxID=1088869 RepID=G6XJT7_9PROT|nr:L-serine ammonia-lyase [Gluconobacter morbifer]EHH67899.1 L-serine deaminase /L-threonine deaminase [Gluconobacter morbifer G707]